VGSDHHLTRKATRENAKGALQVPRLIFALSARDRVAARGLQFDEGCEKNAAPELLPGYVGVADLRLCSSRE